MANISDYLETQLINHIFRTSTYSKPSTLAIALVKTPVTDSQTGATIDEVNGTNYARVELAPADANWANTNGSNGQTNNLSLIQFPAAGDIWGTIVGLAVLDNATIGQGNVLFWSTFSESKSVGTNDVVAIDIGNLTITLA